MWSFFRLRPELITLHLTPHHLSCAVIRPYKGTHQFTLAHYAQWPHQPTDMHNDRLYNLTRLSEHVRAFCAHNNIRKPYCALAVNVPTINERLVRTAAQEAAAHELVMPQHTHWQWQHAYMHPAIDGDGFVSYLCGMPHSFIVQCHALACCARMQLIQLTTARMSILSLYRLLYGNAYRATQLGDHLIQKHDLASLVPPHMLARVLHMPDGAAHYDKQAYTDLAVSCGLIAKQERYA